MNDNQPAPSRNQHGGAEHERRHTGKFFRLTGEELLGTPEVMELRRTSDAAEAMAQQIENRIRR